MAGLLVLDVQRVGFHALRAQARHDARLGGDLRHCDPDKKHLNRVLVGTPKPLDDCRALVEERDAKIQAGVEKPFTRILLSASPEHFRPDGRTLDAEATRAFFRDAVRWLKTEYGEGLVYAVAHLDEKTPHLHAVCVPLYRKTTKHGSTWAVSHHKHPATAGRDSYSRLHDRASAALGLTRGAVGGQPRTRAEREADERAQAVEAAARERAARTVADAQAFATATRSEAAQAWRALDADRTAHEKEKAATAAAMLVVRDEARRLGMAPVAARLLAARRAIARPPLSKSADVAR